MNLQPIIPFEPQSTELLPQGKEWVAQVKWDGVRVLTYYDGTEVKLYNRKKRERTNHYPELAKINTYCSADSCILDGEVIALNSEGKPSFHKVMRRDSIRRQERVEIASREVPIFYMIFDLLYYHGQWINHWPLEERTSMLSEVINPGHIAQLVPFYDDAEVLYKVTKEKGLEGVVIKDRHSQYVIGGKSDRWQKKKNYREKVAVIGGVSLQNGDIRALLLGLYNQREELVYVGRVGASRFRHENWLILSQVIKPLLTSRRPFARLPLKQETLQKQQEMHWVEPVLTVRVRFIEWTPEGTMRQPSIQAFVQAEPKQQQLDNELESNDG